MSGVLSQSRRVWLIIAEFMNAQLMGTDGRFIQDS